jgi:L-histidine Nalpha-methyltransferase
MMKTALDRIEVDSAGPDSLPGSEFGHAMLRALRGRPRTIAPKYFYDRNGASLFQRICQLDEYYLTRSETAILREQAPQFAQLAGVRADLVEFGAGSFDKARIVLGALSAPRRYIPVDLATEHFDQAGRELERAYPGLVVEPLAADFAQPLALPARRPGDGRRVGLFLGSTIGNLTPAQALAFLAGAAPELAGGGLLVGVDLVKDPGVLHRAYNDAQGITAAFNRNLLERANRELGTDFDPVSFDHYAFYRLEEQRIEMHLVSRRRQIVHLGGHAFEFAEGESLHTENSYKYTIEGFRELAREAGFEPGPVWCDRQQRFSLHWLVSATAPKDRRKPAAVTPQRHA